MSAPLRLAINGGNGRMGRALQALLGADGRFVLSGVFGRDADWGHRPACDVLVDFSVPAGFGAALDYCVATHTPLVSGTTGLDATRRTRIDAAAASIPLLYAANFSIGIAVLTRVVREAAAALPEWDLEVIEAHHARKADAPSGTALALGRAAAAARRQSFDAVAVLAREGRVGERPAGAIGFASIRAADIVGEHTALLASSGERLELTHRATDRAIFARGALAAAAWLVGQAPGLYSLEDMLAR